MTVYIGKDKLDMATPIDVACVGIGENRHLAFNDPAAALLRK